MTDLPTQSIDLKAVLSGSSPTAAKDDHSEGMSYLQSLPRRLVTLYLPLSIIVFILLFPFYWMGLTAIKPDEQLIDLETIQSVLDLESDLQAYPQAVVRKLLSALAVEHDVCRGRAPPSCRFSPACWRPMRSCGCATRARSGSAG